MLRLPVQALKGVPRAVALFAPAAIVVAGAHRRDEAAERWTAVARSAADDAPVALFARGAQQGPPIRRAHPLDRSPLTAHRQLLRLASAEPLASAG